VPQETGVVVFGDVTPRNRKRAALRAHRQLGMDLFNHAPPHFPIQGLIFRDKKSFATANSPILACRSRAVSSAVSAMAAD
jgi:hypothetical protein